MWQSKIETNNFQVYEIERGLSREQAKKKLIELRKELRL